MYTDCVLLAEDVTTNPLLGWPADSLQMDDEARNSLLLLTVVALVLHVLVRCVRDMFIGDSTTPAMCTPASVDGLCSRLWAGQACTRRHLIVAALFMLALLLPLAKESSCVATDASACAKVQLNGTPSECTRSGRCSWSAAASGVTGAGWSRPESCVATELATCDTVVLDGKAACTSAGACTYRPGWGRQFGSSCCHRGSSNSLLKGGVEADSQLCAETYGERTCLKNVNVTTGWFWLLLNPSRTMSYHQQCFNGSRDGLHRRAQLHARLCLNVSARDVRRGIDGASPGHPSDICAYTACPPISPAVRVTPCCLQLSTNVSHPIDPPDDHYCLCGQNSHMYLWAAFLIVGLLAMLGRVGREVNEIRTSTRAQRDAQRKVDEAMVTDALAGSLGLANDGRYGAGATLLQLAARVVDAALHDRLQLRCFDLAIAARRQFSSPNYH